MSINSSVSMTNKAPHDKTNVNKDTFSRDRVGMMNRIQAKRRLSSLVTALIKYSKSKKRKLTNATPQTPPPAIPSIAQNIAFAFISDSETTKPRGCP